MARRKSFAKKPNDTNYTLADAYTIWTLNNDPRSAERKNSDRSKTDLLNHQRALECFAAGYSEGKLRTSEILITALEVPELSVATYVEEGAKLLAERNRRKIPSAKTVANLASCFRAIRTSIFTDESMRVRMKSTRLRLAALPKRKSRIRFPTADWPEQFAKDWQDYRMWKTKLLLSASEGPEYRRKRCRPRTIDDGHVSNINPYIGYLVRECRLTAFGMADACDHEHFKDFINWHLNQDADGGYVFLKHCSAVLATISQFLVATRQIPELVGTKKQWDAFYEIGRDVMSIGAERGHVLQADDVGSWKPSDLHALGLQGWDFEPPRDHMTSPYVHTNTIFNRKRTALFFYLAYETPLRARNWLEMKWGTNLSRTRDGRWRVYFKGDELKIGRRGFAPNIYEVVYSEAASHRISLWRKVLAKRFGPDFETLTPYVFPPNNPLDRRSGQQLSHGAFSQGVKSMVMELRGETFHPHKIRHIVGSYLVNERGPGGLGLAAKLLGDTPQVILDAYYRPDTTQHMASYVGCVR